MAGIIVGRIRAGGRYRGFDWVEFGGTAVNTNDDYADSNRYLAAALAQCPEREQEIRTTNHRAKTRRFLKTRANWVAVEAIAQALLERETLDGPEAIAIIEQARREVG
jgi:ATP-dependent Zn protease